MTKSEIEQLARKYGSETYEWSKVSSLFFGLDPIEIARKWANDNMMWVEFHYDEEKKVILDVTFGSSK